MDLTLFGLTDIVISLKATFLANFFAMLILFSFSMILFLVPKYKVAKSFYALLFLLMSSLYLIVYANDYLLFFIGWEVMSISTYFLLSFNLDKKALQKYILFAMASALSLFIAIVMLYSTNHSFLYADAKDSFDAMSSSLQFAFTALILLAIFIKLGTIGFHYWLVDSYEQSHNLFTPLLSAIVSKMGVYALIIFVVHVTQPTYVLMIMGVLTSIIATFKAINEDSIKRLLAYSSIAQLGYIVTVVSVADGLGGALYHSLIHTAVKLLLFINIAGIMFVTNKHKFSQLGGLIYKMPQSFVLLLVGIITLAGMPPLAGFASKFMIYTTLLDSKNLLILSATMFSSASAFLYVYKLIYGIYLGHPSSKKLEETKEVPMLFLIPQYIIAIVLIVLGTYPALLVPYFNSIMQELNLHAIPFTNTATLSSTFAQYNGLVIMGAFVVVFALILVLFNAMSSKVKKPKDRFDIAYCGEVANESTHLHYGFSMGKELKRVSFINLILKNSSSLFYDYVARQTMVISEIVRKIYSGNIMLNFNIAVVFAIILFWWSLK